MFCIWRLGKIGEEASFTCKYDIMIPTSAVLTKLQLWFEHAPLNPQTLIKDIDSPLKDSQRGWGCNLVLECIVNVIKG